MSTNTTSVERSEYLDNGTLPSINLEFATSKFSEENDGTRYTGSTELFTVEYVDPSSYGSSEICVHGKPPHRVANYFYIKHEDEPVRVVNFWEENMIAARKRFLDDKPVRVHIYRVRPMVSLEEPIATRTPEYTYILVNDERIPSEWYNGLDFTGMGRNCFPSNEIMADMRKHNRALIGNPNTFYSEYDDPNYDPDKDPLYS